MLTARAPWDVVLAADVLDERRNLPLLLGLLPALTGPRGEVWLADPHRALAGRVPLAAARRQRLADRDDRAPSERPSVYGQVAAPWRLAAPRLA